MEASATELSEFVDRVLAATGTAKVDMLGHSEGGLVSTRRSICDEAFEMVKHGHKVNQGDDFRT